MATIWNSPERGRSSEAVESRRLALRTLQLVTATSPLVKTLAVLPNWAERRARRLL